MSLEQELKEKIQASQQKLNEVTMNLERLESEFSSFLDEMGLTREELKDFVYDDSHYHEEIRAKVVSEKKRYDEKLELEQSRQRDPNKVKKTLSEQAGIKPHWLFVR